MIALDDAKAILFLRDSPTGHPHEPDITALLKVCDSHNVPLATNFAIVELIVCYLVQTMILNPICFTRAKTLRFPYSS